MKWEYKIVYINAKKRSYSGLPDEMNLEFDEYGKQGWELVKIEPKLDAGFMIFGIGYFSNTVGYLAFFKKPLA